MSFKGDGGIRILPGGGGAPGGASGAFVRRFVSVAGVPTLAADTRVQAVSGGNEPTLYAPVAVLAGLPADTAAGLLSPTSAIRAKGAQLVGLGLPGQLLLSRVQGTYQAPTQVGAGLSVGQVAGTGSDGAGNNAITLGQLLNVTREVIGVNNRGSLWRLNAADIGASAGKTLLDVRGGGANIGEEVAGQATHRYIPLTTSQLRNPANTVNRVEWDATGLGFFGAAPIAQPTVVGSRGGNAALASLLAQLAALGLIIDGTVA